MTSTFAIGGLFYLFHAFPNCRWFILSRCIFLQANTKMIFRLDHLFDNLTLFLIWVFINIGLVPTLKMFSLLTPPMPTLRLYLVQKNFFKMHLNTSNYNFDHIISSLCTECPIQNVWHGSRQPEFFIFKFCMFLERLTLNQILQKDNKRWQFDVTVICLVYQAGPFLS